MDNHFHDHTAANECGLCCTKIKNMSVTLAGEKILDGIDLHLHCGELTAVIGPNGAGKSTLLKALIGEYRYSGKISFFNAQKNSYSQPVLGYVPQNPFFEKDSPISIYDLFTASGNYPVWFPSHKRARKRVLEALARTNSEHLIDKRLGVLSGGEAQRVMLALALTPLPSILLLDEPFSGLDNVHINDFYSLIDQLRSSYDLSIVMVSHDFEYIRKYADRVVLIDHSIKASGSPDEVFHHPEYLRLFGSDK